MFYFYLKYNIYYKVMTYMYVYIILKINTKGIHVYSILYSDDTIQIINFF